MNEPGDYKLTLVFEYENDNADKKRIKQTFKVHVEDYTDPFPTDSADTPDDEGDDSSSSKTKVIIGVVAGVVGAVVIVAVIVKKKKKHNKKGKVDFNEEI